MLRTHGRCRRGERLKAKAPHGHWKTLTFIAALRHDRIDAPCVLDGPINGTSFIAWVEQFLVPTLKPGDIVILDNLGSHEGEAVRKAIRAAGARLLFLPPYSPGLNPIEQVLAFGRLRLRQAQDAAPKVHRTNRRSDMEAHRRTPRLLHTRRMRQLHRQCRLRFNLNAECSSNKGRFDFTEGAPDYSSAGVNQFS